MTKTRSRSAPSSPDISDQRPIKIAKMDDAVDIQDATTAVASGGDGAMNGNGSGGDHGNGNGNGSNGAGEEPSYRPDAKARRYDRQLRLWASAGQRSLEAARVLLIGTDATGSQALKNLVLPGIAHFTILSDKKVTSADVATNFFLRPDSVGNNAAEEIVKYLKELNPSVEGAVRIDNPRHLLQIDPKFFQWYTLIIAANVEPEIEAELASALWSASETVGGPDIPLIAVRNSGFVGRIEVQLREHCVIDSHPDQTHTLRVDQPFAALEQYARGLPLEGMDSMEHSHVPWVVLLARAVSLWKEQHDGNLPDSNDDAQRDEFRQMLKGWMMKADEENFEEALAQAYKAWTRSELDKTIAGLLNDDAVKKVSSNSKNLHILLHALSQYLQQPPHLPPISPTLPDMHSSTSSYIALQNLYKAQFNDDLVRYKTALSVTLASIDLPQNTIPDEEVESFARNVAAVNVVKGRSLRDRKGPVQEWKQIYDDKLATLDTVTQLGMHLALLASERFYTAHGRWPGSNQEVGEDETAVQADVVGLWSNVASDGGEAFTQSVAEVVRGGFSTLPTTAALLGGIVAQEAIKLVTNQYMPLDNTVVADLVTSRLDKFRL